MVKLVFPCLFHLQHTVNHQYLAVTESGLYWWLTQSAKIQSRQYLIFSTLQYAQLKDKYYLL